MFPNNRRERRQQLRETKGKIVCAECKTPGHFHNKCPEYHKRIKIEQNISLFNEYFPNKNKLVLNEDTCLRFYSVAIAYQNITLETATEKISTETSSILENVLQNVSIKDILANGNFVSMSCKVKDPVVLMIRELAFLDVLRKNDDNEYSITDVCVAKLIRNGNQTGYEIYNDKIPLICALYNLHVFGADAEEEIRTGTHRIKILYA